jgi:hypothetical protein
VPWEAGPSEKEGNMSDAKNGTSDAPEGGLGEEGTIPSGSSGVGVGAGEQSTFEPEEDPEAAQGGESATPDAGTGHA